MTPDPVGRPSPRDVLQHHLDGLVAELPVLESRVRRHDPEAIHDLRVTLRRLRSLLASFRRLYDAGVVERLRAEAAWLAGELGAARDAEVTGERLRRHAEQHPSVAHLLEQHHDARAASGQEAALAALDSDRHAALLRDLRAFVEEPPWSTAPDDAILRGLHKDWERVRRRGRAARSADPAGHEAALHDVRKAAKQLRYSMEALAPVLGDPARRTARRARRVQHHLGVVQDSAVTRQALRRLRTTGATPEQAFTLGEIHAHEAVVAAAAEAAYERRFRRLSRRTSIRWLA